MKCNQSSGRCLWHSPVTDCGSLQSVIGFFLYPGAYVCFSQLLERKAAHKRVCCLLILVVFPRYSTLLPARVEQGGLHADSALAHLVPTTQSHCPSHSLLYIPLVSPLPLPVESWFHLREKVLGRACYPSLLLIAGQWTLELEHFRA